MKKLMLTAAVLAAGVAVAADCERPITPVPAPEKGAAVYQLKMPLKTTKGVATLTTGKETVVGGVCTRTVTPGESVACVYRTADQINIEGLFAICENGCDSLEKIVAPYLWETRRKVAVIEPKVTWTFLHIMGKNFTEAEAFWKINGGMLVYESLIDGTPSRFQTIKEITCAGLGKFDAKKGLYTSLSGNAAGTITASYDLNPKASFLTDPAVAAVVCEKSKIWTCGNILATCADAKNEDTVVYGTWSIKYNASLSKKFFTTGELPFPKYY